jgi:putative membrane-bound dehydrogenase-like protein
MRWGPLSLVITAALLLRAPIAPAADAPPAANDPDDISQSLIPDEGLQVTLWARSPMFFNPTRIDCDERGRIWVAEAVNYRSFNTKKQNPLWHDAGDRIMILDDADGDGKADKSSVFVQDKDLVSPLGVAVVGDKVIVSCSPNLIVYTRDLATDKVLKKEILLTGFGGFDHDHSLHKLEAGPDGRWYFNVGNAGPHVVTDKSGWTLRSGSWYTGGTPYNTKNTPGLTSDDGRIWHGGMMLRINPDGTGLAVLGHGFRNPYGTTVDSFGDLWMNDNDDTQSCRTTWLMRYGDLGYNSKDGSRSWEADKRPGQTVRTAHWRQDDPGVIPAGHVYGNGAPTGICFYENGSLGEKYDDGLLLSCEAGQNVVWGYLRQPKGAGYELEPFKFLRSTDEQDPNYQWSKKENDRRKWFRPSDVTVGTDGAVYVCDWYDQVVGGHQMMDKAGGGTIYRITKKGANPRPPKYDPSTPAGAAEMVKSPANNVRAAGAAALIKQISPPGDEALAQLRNLAWGSPPHVAVRYIWILARLGDPGLKEAGQFTGHRSEEIRIATYRALQQFHPDPLKFAAVHCKDISPAVRREVALSLRDVPLEKSRDLITEIAQRYDGTDGADRWYLEALGTACEGKEEEMFAHLLGKIGDLPLKWTDPFADIAWRLHPVTSVLAWKDRAMSPQISPPRRHQAIDAIAFINDKLAAQSISEIASKGPEDLRAYAAWWLKHRSTNDWKPYGFNGEPASAGGLPQGKPLFSSPTLTKGHVDIDVDITGATKLILIANDAGDGPSCDWADFLNPVLIDVQGHTTNLADLKWTHSENGWGNLNINKNCKDMPLKVGGTVYENGIGGHANLKLVYDIAGKSFTRFKCRAGVDNGTKDLGGSDYSKGGASVRFLVYVDHPTARDQAIALRKTLLDEKAKPTDRESAATAMAKSEEGGRILIALARERKLPDSLQAAITDKITQNPDLSVRALAGKYFPRPAVSGQPFPTLNELAKMQGDAARGRAVFLSQSAACSACHRIGNEGKDIGPDLTKIEEKYDRKALLDAILNPSAAILSGFEAHLVQTKDGDTYAGFIVADSDTLVLKDTAGEQISIPKNQIATRRQLELSIMPNNIALGLTPEQLADLVSYLQSKK